MTVEFRQFLRSATGHDPYPYQDRLAATGLPDHLQVPTGCGKTVAAVLPWLYRRLVSAPDQTPRRLVYALPQHSLADQTYARIAEWLERLGPPPGEIGLHLLAGGSAADGGWRRRPERTAILIGTHDMLLSRALMRGFADGPGMAPVSYGLLHNDVQWVFDEMHLLGPALATTRKLQNLRDLLGTAAPTRTMWMSSTWDPAAPSPRDAGLGLRAARRIRRVDPDPDDYIADLANVLEAAHVPGTQTIAVLNTVERARALYDALRETGREVLLVHSHFRSPDRRRIAAELDTPGQDRIIVAAHALEAGVDISGRTVLTELAPWSPLVQRAGRCNRYGEHAEGGDLLWCTPPSGGPFGEVAAWLDAREGHPITSAGLCDARIRPCAPPAEPLGRRELLRLFDTAADPPGTDSVSRWICEPADHLALVAWRDWESGEPAEEEPAAGRDELCPVPLTDMRGAWIRDAVDGHWRQAVAADLVPGMTVLLDARHGGYLPDHGWAPESPIPVVPTGGQPPDPRAFGCLSWVSLDQHLMETEDEARMLLDRLPELPRHQREAVARAARYHDLGKCHAVFQDMLRSGGGEPPEGLLAKSQAPYNTGRSARSHFRHEFVSALMLLHGDDWQDSADAPLVTYLVAAHHGKVRVSARRDGEGPAYFLGVLDGERTPVVELSSGERFPSSSLQTSAFKTGSWTQAALALCGRGDLGPFRLAYLETLVRVADWRSSARHDGPVVP